MFGGRFCDAQDVTLHDELRELVTSYGPELLRDGDQFRAALDDYVEEGSVLPGQLNLLHDAVRFGALARCLELLANNSEPAMAVQTAGDALARERGTLETASSRWAVATLAAATGNLDPDTLALFLGARPAETATLPEPAAPPTLDVPAWPATQDPRPVEQPSTERVPPPPLPPLPPRKSGRRRGPRIAVAAVAAVALVAGGGYAVQAALDDSGEADAGDPVSPSASSSAGTSSESPPMPPDQPSLAATPGYKKVTFSVAMADDPDDVIYELRTSDGWVPTEARFPIPTARGGRSVCAVVRAARVEADSRIAGPTDRVCARSKPLKIDWLLSPDQCEPEDLASGFTCRQFDLLLEGFRADEAVAIEQVSTTKSDDTVVPCVSGCAHEVTVDADGRARLDNYAFGYGGQTLTIRVADERTEIPIAP